LKLNERETLRKQREDKEHEQDSISISCAADMPQWFNTLNVTSIADQKLVIVQHLLLISVLCFVTVNPLSLCV